MQKNFSQVNRLRPSYPATCPVKISVTLPCPALLPANLPCPALAGQGRAGQVIYNLQGSNYERTQNCSCLGCVLG